MPPLGHQYYTGVGDYAQLQGGVSCPVKQNTTPPGHQYYTGVGRLGSQRSNFIRPRSSSSACPSTTAAFVRTLASSLTEREKFILRQPPIGEKDDYDSENSWISDGLLSSSRRRRRGERGGGGERVDREVGCKRGRRLSRQCQKRDQGREKVRPWKKRQGFR